MPPVARLRIGLIGINARARRLLIPGLQAAPHAELRAVCSRDLTTAREVAGGLGGERGVLAFDSVDAMVFSGEIDAVFVNTPVEAHDDACYAAIEAGLHVICEKPLSTDTRHATAVRDAATHAGVRGIVNFTYRSVAAYRLTERLVAGSALGSPCAADFALLQGHAFLPEFPAAGALLDSGVHLFDILLGLCAAGGLGRPQEVCAEPALRLGTDYGWSFLARTSSGLPISARFSRRALGWRNGLRWGLYGDESAVEAETDGERASVRRATRGDQRPQGVWRDVPLPADIAATETVFPAFHMDRLVGAALGVEFFPDFAAAVETHRLADALARSASERAWVSIWG